MGKKCNFQSMLACKNTLLHFCRWCSWFSDQIIYILSLSVFQTSKLQTTASVEGIGCFMLCLVCRNFAHFIYRKI